MKTIASRTLVVAGALAMFAAADTAAAQAQEPAASAPQAQAAPAAAAQTQVERRREPRRRRDVITKEEMVESGATNLYEVVQRTRPSWLRGGNPSNFGGGGGGYVVYQNTTQLGGLEALRQLSPGYAESLRFLDGSTASNTLPGLGSQRVAGAIVVVLPGSN
jgi:hypothetical protein